RCTVSIFDHHLARTNLQDPPRCIAEEEDVPLHALDREVLVDRADKTIVVRENDAEIRVVRNSASRRGRHDASPAGGTQSALDAIAMQSCASLNACRNRLAKELQDLVVLASFQRSVRPRPTEKFEQFL